MTNDSTALTDSPVAYATTVNGQQETTKSSLEMDSDVLLQASRRVDWRFLLPNPELGHVAYVGPVSGTLLASLRQFSESLAVIETPQRHDENVNLYDVVVTSSPTYESMRWAIGLVRPGGFLYVEASGFFRSGNLPHRAGQFLRLKATWPRYPADYITAVKQLGLAEANAFWFWPNFETCTRIIPLDDPAALHYILMQRHPSSSAMAQVKAKLGRCLLESGLLMRLVPCFSIIARRSAIAVSKQ